MNRLPSVVSPFTPQKPLPDPPRRESYSTPATAGFPLWERTSAPCRSCWNVIGVIINSVPLCTSVFPVVQALVPYHWGHRGSQGETLSAKTYSNARSRRDMRTGEGCLPSRGPAADGIEVEPCFLGRFNGNAQVLAEERRHLDPSLFYVKNHR